MTKVPNYEDRHRLQGGGIFGGRLPLFALAGTQYTKDDYCLRLARCDPRNGDEHRHKSMMRYISGRYLYILMTCDAMN